MRSKLDQVLMVWIRASLCVSLGWVVACSSESEQPDLTLAQGNANTAPQADAAPQADGQVTMVTPVGGVNNSAPGVTGGSAMGSAGDAASDAMMVSVGDSVAAAGGAPGSVSAMPDTVNGSGGAGGMASDVATGGAPPASGGSGGLAMVDAAAGATNGTGAGGMGAAGQPVVGGAGGSGGATASAGSSGQALGGSAGVVSFEGLQGAMVVRGAGTPTPGDNVMIGVIEARGIELTIISDSAVQASDVESLDLIVISSSAESGPLSTKLRDVAVPILCVENGQYRNQGMTGSSRDTHWGEITNQTDVAILPGAEQLVGAFSGNVTISSTAGGIGWGLPADTALIGATVVGDPEQATIFGYEQGAQMMGMTAPARRAGFAIREVLATNLNDEGKMLFDSILVWVLQ